MLRDRLLRRLGPGLSCAWVGAALVGWLPGTPVVIAQAWWWLLASLVVLGVGAFYPPRLRLHEPAWWVLSLTSIALCWTWRMPATPIWLAQICCGVWAGWGVIERFGWKPLRYAVVCLAWLQVLVVIAQALGWHAYPISTDAWTGTVGRRALLGILWALASLWSTGWRAWGLAGLSLCSGSWTGAPIALMRLLPVRWKHPLVWAMLALALYLSHDAWALRFESRWAVWSQVGWWQDHWFSGWGLQQLPVMFQEADHRSFAGHLHNTGLDVLARGGLLGLGSLVALMVWAWRRSQATRTLWTWGFALWVMTWQSIGAQPVLIVLALVWLFSLCNPRRVDENTAQSLV